MASEWDYVIGELGLSKQQARVVGLLLQGMNDKEIADAMGRKIWTVRTHLTRMFDRLGVQDRVQLVVRVFLTARELWMKDL